MPFPPAEKLLYGRVAFHLSKVIRLKKIFLVIPYFFFFNSGRNDLPFASIGKIFLRVIATFALN